jgi:stringent starvation protein B
MDMDIDKLMRETLAARAVLKPLLDSPESRPAQPVKKSCLEKLLSRGLTTVRVNTQLPGVHVPPEYLGSDTPLVLNFSLNFGSKDLQLTDTELCQTLSFAGINHRVRVPLRAVLAAANFIKGEVLDFTVFPPGADEALLAVEGDDDDPEPPEPERAS